MKSTAKLVRIGILVASLLALAGAAQAGDVLCKVVVGSKVKANVVVAVEGVKGKFQPPVTSIALKVNNVKKRAVIDQKNKVFIPYMTAVLVGTTVEFINSDDFLHNTFSSSKPAVFNFNQPTKGSRSLLKTTKAGIIKVGCHIHAKMRAWIKVLSNPYFGVTNKQGLRKIVKVPAGTYKITAWHPKHGTLTRTVKVPASGNVPVIFKYAK